MKRLEEIKNEVAKDFGYESFEQFDDKSTFSYDHKTPKIIDQISKRYALEVAQASLEKAAENANMKVVILGIEDCSQMTKSLYHKPSATEISLNKSSITNESNITLL